MPLINDNYQLSKGVENEYNKDYLSWENDNSKKNFKLLYAKEIKLLNEWLEIYCKEYDCTKEDALYRIIEE